MRVVLVTGAARGIGKTIAECFHMHGDYALGADVAYGPLGPYSVDLRERDAGKRLIDEVMDKWGRLDVLVNNARAPLRCKIGEETEADWDEEMTVGVKTPYFLGKYAIQIMPPGSSIVNIGSVTSYTVSGESGAYQIAKGSCQQLTRVLAQLGASRGVRCNAVLPGAIVKGSHPLQSEMHNVHFAAQHGTPEDVAHCVEFLASEKARFINGASIVLDGGLTIQDNWSTWKRAKNL